MRNAFDGLIHHADGTRWDAETGSRVTEVNDYAQAKSKHSKHEGSTYHEPFIKPWHLGEVAEGESVDQAMDRQEEVDDAEAELATHRHRSTAQSHHKHHKKHHSAA